MTHAAAYGHSTPSGRSLKLFLADGSPNGIITAELGNSPGKAVVAPRTALPALIRREEAAKTGVYLLTGPDPKDTARPLVYVGESDSVKTRLVQHDADDRKSFFTRACLIVSKGDDLTKAHGRYLEARMISSIRKAARAGIQNARDPKFEGLPESDRADMERFLSDVGILLPVLGFDFLRLAADDVGANEQREPSGPVFVMTRAETNARAVETGGEFVVLAGSTAHVRETNTIKDGARKHRRQLVDAGVLTRQDGDEFYTFARDFPFPSPTAAGEVVYGGGVAGPRHWKRESDGMPYKDWRQKELEDAQRES